MGKMEAAGDRPEAEAASPGPPKLMHKPVTDSLKCAFTSVEREEIASECAKAIGEREAAEAAKKSADAQFKGRIEHASTTAADCARKLRLGYEWRGVKCEDTYDYETLTVRRIRLDTGELVSERAMTTEERQTGFAFKEAPG